YQVPFIGKYSDSSEKELIDLCEKKILQAVDRQLLSDVPVGFFLSGGLDSSLLVAMAKRLHPQKKIDCFTIDAGAEISDEGFTSDLDYAKKVADYLKVDLHVVKADIDILRDFDKMIWHLDEPQADAAPLNVSNICQQARSMGFKVLIGGTAGDDIFSGYRRHQALEIEKYLKLLPRWVSEGLLKLPLNRKNPLFRRVTKVLIESTQTTAQRLANYYRWLSKETVDQLFDEQYQSIVKQHNPTDYLINRLADIPNENSWLNRMLYWEMTSFLVDHNLNYTDKMAMAHGVEVRVPFLDNELVEFACTIPPSLKMKGQETKYILKKVAERYLPNEVIYRPKTGFGAPVRKWITTDMKPLIAERLSPMRISGVGIFDSQKIQQLIADNEAGKIDASYSIWSLLAIDSWIRQFSTQKTTEILETTNSKS
ncbi:MAG: asparagine synthase C-terminal domain-containing protein, partial [Cytophagales bacterium]|nr:asparagine synthase C-terminal domain-containing protein [Cytophagales bacterium]